MSLSRGTVLEIYTNPTDLTFYITELDGKYAGHITRGPRRRYTLLFKAEPIFVERKDVIGIIRSILEIILLVGKDESGESADTLNQQNVDQILRELTDKGFCTTFL